ncbi:MAG: DUF3427 domain-containing protein [Lachnospiraceae bacterium]|nr:DUF3427 domain-containing protein [Lachnospiraceae bacterium]
MMNKISEEINSGAITAFIDLNNKSNLAYKPVLLANDHKAGTKVLTSIEEELKSCRSFIFSVAFITMGGVEPLLQVLKELEIKGIPGKILTTDYNTFTDPKALDKLGGFNNIDLRIYRVDENAGFHTKGYIFQKNEVYTCILGSSNMTATALSVNKEWNTRFVSTENGEMYQRIQEEFDTLWNDSEHVFSYDEFIDEYKARYEIVKKQRKIAIDASRQNENGDIKPLSLTQYRLKPNSMQVAFTENLRKIFDKGETKALLISATGTGKTYASAFGIRDALKPSGKVLFIVHRKQILKQALKSYKNVFGRNVNMALLTGEDQNYDEIQSADFVFAMITMISKEEVMHRFSPDFFSVCVVDEVHHMSAPSYRRIMGYFNPEFWLGMTATPDRTDEGNIYEMFDHNIAYEIRLQQALDYNLLCPFHYFGIRDIAFNDSEDADEMIKLAEKGDLTVFRRLISDERLDYILKETSYYGFSGERVKGLIFCSSVREAKELSLKMNQRGLRTKALSGNDSDDERQKAIERLIGDECDDALDYILTVNIFNEGVDIPDINQVVMLRPTESSIVFIQQLGRGLRKKEDKEYVVVLDFIGNYSNNFMIPIALSGDRTYNKDNLRKYIFEGSNMISGCSSIHFDEISRKSIFAAIDKATTPLKMLKEKYFNLRDRLGRMPSAYEFYQYGEIDPILFIEYRKASYYSFVRSIDKDCGLEEFSDKQERTLDYICTQIVNGKRPDELVMLSQLIEEENVSYEGLRKRLEAYGSSLTRKDFESSVRVLDKSFLNTQADVKKYEDVSIIMKEGKDIHNHYLRCASYMLKTAQTTNSDKRFCEAVEDLIRYGLARYKDFYSESEGDNLVLYQKYSRRDVCRILNWERDDSSTIYGYRIKYGTCPIFVTYEKKDDISETTKYEDQFIDQSTFSWMTRSRVSVNSPESQEIIHSDENGLKMYLFIKKSDGEGTDFYYMGRVRPTSYVETTINDKNGNKLPIMNFRLKMEHMVRNDIYDYLTK